MKKRITGFLLALCLALTLMPSSAVFAAPVYWADEGLRDVSWYGDGTAAAYTISTPAQLGGLAHLVNSGADTFENKTITLGANINLDASSWLPIGIQDHPFMGLFDGAGYAVTGMSLTVMTEYAGFFGMTDSAMLVNIALSGSVAITYNNDDVYGNIGALVGLAQGTVIENCSYTGSVTFLCSAPVSSGSAYDLNVGGLAGRTVAASHNNADIASSVVNCSMVGDVVVSSVAGHYNARAGGLVGQTYGTDIFNCYHRGDTDCNLAGYIGYACGLVGEMGYNATLKNCYSSGIAACLGAGENNRDTVCLGSGTFEDNYGDDTHSTAFVTPAALNGWISSGGGDACRPWREDTESENGGLPLFAGTTWQTVLSGNVGLRPAPRSDAMYSRYYETHYKTKGAALSLPIDSYTRKLFVFDGWSTLREGAAAYTDSVTPSGNLILYLRWKTAPTLPYTGQLTAGYYSISTAAQLAKLSSVLAQDGFGDHQNAISQAVFILTRDMDLGCSDSFDFNSDGDTLDEGETWTGGTNWLPIGGAEWNFEEMTFRGDGHKITGMTILGTNFSEAHLGLFGTIEESVINDLYVSGSITVSTGSPDLSDVYAGGIAGTSERSTISNCGADVNISITYDNNLYVQMGGLVGYLLSGDDKSVLNCFATGTLFSSGTVNNCRVGGIAGYVRKDDIRNCYFAGAISGTGSPADPDDDTAVSVGGLAGYIRDGILTHCYYLTDTSSLSPAGRVGGDLTFEGCGTFSGNTGVLTPLPTQTLLGTHLLAALNAWIGAQPTPASYKPWHVVAGYNGAYPQFLSASTNDGTGGEPAPNAPISDTGDSGLPLLVTFSALAALSAGAVTVKKRRRG